MEIKTNTIYLFTKAKVLYAVAKVNIDNLDTDITFGQGFKLIKDPSSKLNDKVHIYRRARKSVVADVSNALNAYQMFGEEVFNDKGELDYALFQKKEFKYAWKISRNKKKEYDKKIEEYKVVEISLKQAKDNNLI
jgi:hypothetical protein